MSGETLPILSTIAIDGPVGAGKTSVGKAVSRRLDYRFLDTGVMYRALAWLAMENGIVASAEKELGQLAEGMSIKLPNQEDQWVVINGYTLSEELRAPEVDRIVSEVSKTLNVRLAMVKQQREIAQHGNIVVVGRDIGTVVLPSAAHKIFLDAPVSERAARRFKEILKMVSNADYQDVLQDLLLRDQMDTKRTHSPLAPAWDAHLVDTGGLDLEQVTEKVLSLIGSHQ